MIVRKIGERGKGEGEKGRKGRKGEEKVGRKGEFGN